MISMIIIHDHGEKNQRGDPKLKTQVQPASLSCKPTCVWRCQLAALQHHPAGSRMAIVFQLHARQAPGVHRSSGGGAGKRSRRSEVVGGSGASNIFQLMSLNCNKLWSRSGNSAESFHGFAQFWSMRGCKIAFLQETFTPAMPSLPDEQTFSYSGPENSRGRDATFLIHENQSATCRPIPNITLHYDICWRIISHAEGCASTAVASFYAPHVGARKPNV